MMMAARRNRAWIISEKHHADPMGNSSGIGKIIYHQLLEEKYMVPKKRHKAFVVLTVFVMALLSPCVEAEIMANYYVSLSGSDDNPGTEDLPFRTIEKARDVIRERTGTWTGDIYVWIRGGTYSLTAPLKFTEKDSGKDGYYVAYQAYTGERPVISGGRQITGWTKYNDSIYQAQCPAEANGFRQLYIKEKRAIRARTPNINNYNRLYQWRVSDKTVRVKDEDLKGSWQNISNGKVEIIIQQYWAESIMRIEAVMQNGAYKDIVPKATERDIVFGRDWPQKSPNQAYHFENSLDFIDQGGEWYLDDNVVPNRVYYMPREGEDLSQDKVVVPVLDTLISIIGSDPGTKVDHLIFEGITFEHANWTRPSSQGNIGLQSQQYSIGDNQCDRPKAGIFIQNAEHMRLTRNEFRNMGSAGLDVYTGTNNIVIEGNVFHDIAGNGMQVGKFTEEGTEIAVTYNPTDPREFCENIIIANNYIYRVAQDYYSGNGIAAGYIRHSSIVHNEIKDLPYTAISVGWGWTTNPCAMTNNNIEYNRIYNVVNLLCDGAGIYTLGYSPDSYIRYNYVHGIVKSSWATTSYTNTYPLACVYLDQGSKGYTIDQNVLRDAHNDNYINHGMNTLGDNIEGTNYRDESSIEKESGIEPDFQDIRKIDLVLSVDEPNLKPSFFKVYPTITTDELYIDLHLEAPSLLEISVYSITGTNKLKRINYKPVQAGDGQLKMNVGNLSAGTYICLIRTAERVATEKFIVL